MSDANRYLQGRMAVTFRHYDDNRTIESAAMYAVPDVGETLVIKGDDEYTVRSRAWEIDRSEDTPDGLPTVRVFVYVD